MVIVQPRLQRCAYLIDVWLNIVPWVGARLVLHFFVNHELCGPPHVGKFGKTCVRQVNKTDVIEQRIHALAKFAAVRQRVVIEAHTGTIDGE